MRPKCSNVEVSPLSSAAQTALAAAPRAWTAATLDDPAAWYYPLPGDCLTVLDELLEGLRRSPRPLVEFSLPQEHAGTLREGLLPALNVLERGRGFVILTGLDLSRYSEDEAKAFYWLVGQALGVPFRQNVQGTILYDVRDTGKKVSEGVRFSVTNAESSFHTDNSFGETVLDYVGLLCLKTARSGGVNQMVSGYAAYAILGREFPAQLAVLSHPFHVDRRGGVEQGQSPTAEIPVLEMSAGALLVRYLRYWIHEGHAKVEQPLSGEQLDALNTLDAVLNRPELRAEFALTPGDMFFLNNRWTLHNRTAFDDHPEPERRRHLVRLWLQRRSEALSR
jgi:alpha-ketoglutarate-dependent taurine dioxygenase